MDSQPAPKERPDVSSLIIPGKDAWRQADSRRGGGGTLGWAAGALLLAALTAAWIFRDSLLVPSVAVVTVRMPGRAELDSVLTANGYVMARREASLGPKASGVLEWIGVEEGSRVAKGQVLARLESGELAAQLEEARATAAQDGREVERLRRLREGGFSPEADLERAESRLDVDRARLALAEAQMENTLVRAPFDGIVTRKDMEVGEMLAYGTGAPGTGVLRVVDMESLEMQADVSESNVSRLAPEQPAQIRVDALPGLVFEGRLRQVIPTADRQKGTVEVRVSILAGPGDGDLGKLLPESAAQVTFMRFQEEREQTAQAPPGMAVPASALAEHEGARGAVFVVRDGRALRREVEILSLTAQAAEIRGALQDGDAVAAEGAEGLRDGQRVRIAEKN